MDFSINLSETVDSVRSVSFDKIGDSSQSKNLQLRVGSKGNPMNIIGFVIKNR